MITRNKFYEQMVDYDETCDMEMFYKIFSDNMPAKVSIYITYANTSWLDIKETVEYHHQMTKEFNKEL